jgi:DNA-binding transcriptional ArsR family regulator
MDDFAILAKLDKLVHNPGRLAILAVLAGCESADFTFLEQMTRLNKGTLSKHLTALEGAGYLEITKRFKGRMPNTSVRLAARGSKAFRNYRRQYRQAMDRIERAEPDR